MIPATAKRPLFRPVLVAVLVGAAILIAIVLRPGAGAPSDVPAETPEVVMQLLPSELYEVQRSTLRETVQITGSLVPVRELTISAEVTGRIEAMDVREGQAVAEGDLLATIDVRALRNQLEQQEATASATLAQLDLARTQLARTDSLVRRGTASATTLETETANVAQLEASYAALQRQVETARDDLSKARIVAPFDGIVSSRLVNQGTFVSPGAEMLGLVDIDSLVLEGGIPVTYGPRLRVGQTVSVRVEGVSDRVFDGTIDRIAPVAVSGTRVLPVYASLENTDGVLRGGMFAAGDLVLEESGDSIGIPATAIRTDGDQSYVIGIVDDRATRVDVQVLRPWNRGRTAEVTGLTPGDLIVSQPLEQVLDGMRVNRIGG